MQNKAKFGFRPHNERTKGPTCWQSLTCKIEDEDNFSRPKFCQQSISDDFLGRQEKK